MKAREIRVGVDYALSSGPFYAVTETVYKAKCIVAKAGWWEFRVAPTFRRPGQPAIVRRQPARVISTWREHLRRERRREQYMADRDRARKPAEEAAQVVADRLEEAGFEAITRWQVVDLYGEAGELRGQQGRVVVTMPTEQMLSLITRIK